MKKVYRIKLPTHGQPIHEVADGFQINDRTQILQVFNNLGRTGDGERMAIETVFSAAGGQWCWIRKVDEVE
jgi:hypothetical protein